MQGAFAIFLHSVNRFPLQIAVDFNIALFFFFLPAALQKGTIGEMNS